VDEWRLRGRHHRSGAVQDPELPSLLCQVSLEPGILI
jgi:hypothetical protein